MMKFIKKDDYDDAFDLYFINVWGRILHRYGLRRGRYKSEVRSVKSEE